MRPSIERRLVDVILRLRVVVLVVIALISAVAATFAAQVGFDSDIEIWFLDDDENLTTYHTFLDRFEADEITIIGLFGDDLFTPEVIAAVDAITEAAADKPHVHRVRSLTNVKVVQSKGPGHVAVERLMTEVPLDDEAALALRDRVLAHEILQDNLVGASGQAIAIIAELDPAGNNFDDKITFVEALRGLAAEHIPPGVEWHVAGSPVLDEAFFKYTERDFAILGPLAFLVVVLACLLLFRRAIAVFVPLGVVGLSLIWLFGLMGALGVEINIISSGLMALVLAVGVADSVHVISDYLQALMAGHERDEAVAHATATLLVPCLFTSTTTAAGFLSLLIGDLEPVRQFGWLAAIGVTVAFVLSMTVIPCVLSLVPAPPPAYVVRQRQGRLTHLLERLGRPSRGAARAVVLASLALTVAGGFAVGQLDTEANPMNYFLPGDPVREGMQRVDQELGGSSSFEFMVETAPGGLKDHAILQRLDDLATRLESLGGVTHVLSVLDSLRETRRVLTDGESDAVPGPDDHPHLAAQLYLFLESDSDFSRDMRENYSLTRLTARVRMSEANLITAEEPRVAGWLRDDFGSDGLRVRSTGFIKLMSEMESYLFTSQVRSLLVAFTVIGLMMFLLLGSLRLGLLAMIPNFVPIAAGLAFMAVAGIALDPGTVMIGSIALGLVVDDTVHFLVRLKRNLADHELPDAIARAMHQTGRPIILTSIILAGGFGTLGFGSFTPNVAFGAVSAVVILVAMLADLVLLPSALLVLNPRVRARVRVE